MLLIAWHDDFAATSSMRSNFTSTCPPTDWEALEAIQEAGAEDVMEEDLIGLDQLTHVTGLDVQFGGAGDTGVYVAAHLPFPNTGASPNSYYVHLHSTNVPYKDFWDSERLMGMSSSFKNMGANGCEPQCVMVDGNGVLHPRRFGSASHFGVTTGICTIGVAKQLHCCCGSWTEQSVRQAMAAGGLLEMDLADREGCVLARAMKLDSKSMRPVYVSVGHGISLDTACRVVRHCMRFRVPEPVRAADQHARRFAAKLK